MYGAPFPDATHIWHSVKPELLLSAKVVGKSQVMLLFELPIAADPKGSK